MVSSKVLQTSQKHGTMLHSEGSQTIFLFHATVHMDFHCFNVLQLDRDRGRRCTLLVCGAGQYLGADLILWLKGSLS